MQTTIMGCIRVIEAPEARNASCKPGKDPTALSLMDSLAISGGFPTFGGPFQGVP